MSETLQISSHQFGPGVIRELATKLYKSPISAFREAVSNGLDAMIPFNDKRIEIRTNVGPDGDIEIEDWGTGIEDYNLFTIVSPGEKIVKGEVSSNEKLNEKIIGQKGMGKLSFLNLSEISRVEFYSNNEKVGMHVIMTIEGFSVRHMNSHLVLPHRGLKVAIKKAKRSLVDTRKLCEYLSKYFSLRIARGTKIYVDETQIHKPQDFDSRQSILFSLSNGIKIFGNLKNVEKPKSNNIDIFVKQVFVDSKGFDYKVEGWLNCNSLDLETSRDGIYEGNEIYIEFINSLRNYLDKNYEIKSQPKEKEVKSEKQIAKMFVNIIKSINDLYPEMNKPFLSGIPSNSRGFGALSKIQGDESTPCTEREGIIDELQTSELAISKPIGNGKSHKIGKGESYTRIKKGDSKILAPSIFNSLGNGMIREPKIIVVKVVDKPVVFFSAPDRLVINQLRASSSILLDASPRDPTIKSRILPLLVRAGIDAFPGSSELSVGEWFKKYDTVLDSVYS